jgi:hypothetical protein
MSLSSNQALQTASGLLDGGLANITTAEGAPGLNIPVASFTDGNPLAQPSDFTITIDWGDGTATAGVATPLGPGGAFQVFGDHIYGEDGDFPISVTITDGGSTLLLSGVATVADAQLLPGAPVNITTTEGAPLTNIPVATFTDDNPNAPPSDFTVLVDWGDGVTTDGTVTGANGSFTVSGSHTYADGGSFPINVTVSDEGGQTTSVSGTATVADGSLVPGAPVNIITTESAPVGPVIATFTDTNPAAQATDFTASIDWGDGTVTNGLVSEPGGPGTPFQVLGTHTYTDEGSEPLSVTLTRTVDGTTATATGTVNVIEADALTGTAKSLSIAAPNTDFSDTVATFTDSDTANVAGDFTSAIDWGDGTTTVGTVSGGNGSFTVAGGHTYATATATPITVTLTDDGAGTASATAHGGAMVGLFGLGPEIITIHENDPVAGTIARFTDGNSGDVASDFAASIDWGDGTTTTGQVTPEAFSGFFDVLAFPGHTYADEGTEQASVTLTRTADGTTAVAPITVNVIEADALSLTPSNVRGDLALNNVMMATFTDTNISNVAGDFAATIDWGDGQTTTGTVSGSNGVFTVDGSHRYATAGQKSFSVTVADDPPGTATASANGTAAVGLFGAVPGLPVVGHEDALISPNGPLASFIDGDSNDAINPGSLTATINWGDGTPPTPGSVNYMGGVLFSVSALGPHLFADESQAVTTTITRVVDGSTLTVSTPATISDFDVLSVAAHDISGNPSQPFSNVSLALFTDTNFDNVAGDFTAIIDWGDGTTNQGSIIGLGGGNFAVTGSHTYTTGGTDTFKVTVSDDAPGTATNFGTATADINFADQMLLNSATEGTALANSTPVAAFTDSNGGDTAVGFTASINWGDGTTTTGSVIGGGGTFTVEGGHTYADEGNDIASVTLIRTSDQVASTVSGAVAVAEGDILTPHGTLFQATAKASFSGSVATFTDIDAVTPASDFTASVNWGDGTTDTGAAVTIVGGNGSFTVGGSHSYAVPGQDIVKVTLTDDAPSTVTATATSTVDVANTVPFDLNGDTVSDLVFQNNGQPGIWLWNGTAPTAEVGLANPGASWHIITSRDVNGDGNADLIWQNTDGTPGVWLMNATTPTAEVGLTNPGSSWHVVASGDTNGDGNSDLIWQNTDRTLGVWLMNGTTPTAEVGIGNPGSNWRVVGAADFSGDGNDDILLQDRNTGNLMIDVMNGTTISSTKTITVGDPSWHAVSTGTFNGQAEIAWQNNNGTVGLWLMNGTTPVA